MLPHHSFLRSIFSAIVLFGLTNCAAEPPAQDADDSHLSQQQTPPASAAASSATDFACTSSADCAQLNSSCGRSTCDAATKKCTLVSTAPEGTACGAGSLCDNLGRCLPCGGAATSTYGLVQTTIFDSPRHGCNGQVCHGSSPGQAMLNLSADVSYKQILNVPGVLNPAMMRIKPGDTGQSYVFRKMYWATSQVSVPGGSPMPAGGAPPVPSKLLGAMNEWIIAGASDMGFVPGSVAKFCEAPCLRNADCANGNQCDGVEQCQAGKCVPGAPLSCDDGKACTADRCDPATGCKSVTAPGLACEGGVCDDSGACQACSGVSCPPTANGKLEQLWDFPVSRASSSTPLVRDGVVYATFWDAHVVALDAKTGKVKWDLDTKSRVMHGGVIAAPDGTLLFGDGDAVIWRVDTAGNVLWKVDLDVTDADHVWSNLTVVDDLVYVPLASHTDVPCTKGRTVALALATGKTVWERYNVPKGGVCRTDTAVQCTTSADCPSGGACESAVGGAVTGTITPDPDGNSLYVNTVGCYTFPQVGDTDAMMKLDAKTGEVKWLRRFSADEQFNMCQTTGKNCRNDADCGEAGGACVKKANYADFGFINGPLLVDAKDGKGGTRKLLVSGDKSAGVVAVYADTGEIAWINQVLPKPVSPGFAGYGLFNGKLAYEDGKVFGALYETVPTPAPVPDHLMAFNEIDGKIVWSDDIGKSWSSLTVHNGVLYAGTQTAPVLYAYNTKTGARLGTYELPANSAGSGTVVDGVLYIGYGVYAAGGVRAYTIR